MSAPAYDILAYYPDPLNPYKAGQPVGPYLYAKFAWDWSLPAMGVFKVKASHPMVETWKTCRRKVCPIVTSRNGIQWDGRVMDVEIEWEAGMDEPIVTVYCINNLYWLLTVLGWVNPFFPPEVQIYITGKQNIMFGPVDWVFKYFFGMNGIRQGIPVFMKMPVHYEVPRLPNLADLLDIDELLSFVNGIDFTVVSTRFTQLDEAFKQTVENGIVGMSCDLVIPTAEDPGPTVFNTEGLNNLQMVIDATSDYFMDPTLLPELDEIVTDHLTSPGYVFDTKQLRERKWQVWSTGVGGNIVKYKRKISHARASSVIVGGQSPSIMNSIVEFAANLAVQAIAGAITAAFGLPGIGAIAVGDMFDNIFFAFQEFEDTDLKNDLGYHGFREGLANNTAAWTVDGFSVGLNELQKRSGGDTIQYDVITGPSTLQFGADIDEDGNDVSGRRYQHGDLVTVHDEGTYLENYISHVEVEDARDGHIKEYITWGGDPSLRDQWGQFFGMVKSLANVSTALSLN